MSAVSIEHRHRVEQLANQLASAVRGKYPHITTEIIYAPPGGVSAWVQVEGATDPEENDEITSSTLDMQLEALEKEGILVLVV